MTNKIEKLMKELQEECDKQDLNLVLSLVGPTADAVCVSGSGAGVTMALANLFGAYKERMIDTDCDCPICKAARKSMESKIPSSEEILKSFFGGGIDD